MQLYHNFVKIIITYLEKMKTHLFVKKFVETSLILVFNVACSRKKLIEREVEKWEVQKCLKGKQ